jgi:hypothetical protein
MEILWTNQNSVNVDRYRPMSIDIVRSFMQFVMLCSLSPAQASLATKTQSVKVALVNLFSSATAPPRPFQGVAPQVEMTENLEVLSLAWLWH